MAKDDFEGFEEGNLDGYLAQVKVTELHGSPVVLVRVICDNQDQVDDLLRHLKSR